MDTQRLLCATDGCFAYVRSPMHFEHLLLSTMQGARDAPDWQRALEAEVTAITGDDAAIALLGLGADLGGFKQRFKDQILHDVMHGLIPRAVIDSIGHKVAHQLPNTASVP